MAAVYEVRDLLTREHHALKILEDPDGRHLFDREYEVMNRLNNPGIVRTYRYGQHEDMPWMTMELLYGESAQAFVKAQGRPGTPKRTQEVLRIGGLTARALHYLHGHRIVHRDVKGSNIVLLPDRRVKLVDFGIAYLSDAPEHRTQGANFLGTPGYAAPEQILGGKLDGRSDVYSLAVLLYRLLTGRVPFHEPDLGDLLRAHLNAPRPHVRDLVPNLPERLDTLIFQMMSADPAARPRNAGVVADALDAMVGKTILPGNELAIHTPLADARERVRRAVLHRRREHRLVLLVGNDERDRLRILQMLADEVDEPEVRGLVVSAQGSQAKAAIATALLEFLQEALPEDPQLATAAKTPAALEISTVVQLLERAPGLTSTELFLALQMGDLDPEALSFVVELAHALESGPTPALTVVIGCSEGAAGGGNAAKAEEAGATTVPIPPLSAYETALAVGLMIGRRPPAGALAQRIYDVTAGWPTAVEDVVQDLVAKGEVVAEGDQLLWSRYELEIPIPAALRAVLADAVNGCSPRERHILSAVALMHGATYRALDAHIPHSEGILEQVLASLIEKGLLAKDEDGLLRPGTRTLGVMLRAEITGERRKAIRKLLSRQPDTLPRSFFRVRAMLRAGRLQDALEEVLTLAQDRVSSGRWKEASVILEEVYNEASSLTVTSELAELLLLYARCGLATGRRDIATAQALSVIRRFVRNDAILTQCDLMEAELQRSIGHYANYRTRVAQGVDRAVSVQDPAVRARLSFSLGQGQLWLGNLYEAEDAFKNAREILAEETATPLASQILSGLAECAYGRGELAAAEEMATEALEHSGEDPVALSAALRVWADIRRRQGRYSEALTRLRTASVQMRAHEDQRPYTRILVGIAWCECELHRLGLAQECLDELAAVIREGELLHIRLERTILEGRLRILSGQARNAEYLLSSAENSAKNAGLTLLASQARSHLITAQHLNGTLREPLDDWMASRRIDYLANRHLWSFVDAAVTCLRVTAPRTGLVDDILAPAKDAIARKGLHPLEVDIKLAVARSLRASGKKREALLACRDATKIVAQISKDLADTERSALRVHPWPREVQALLKSQ